MARQKGIIKLKGTIGDITFYKTQDGHLAREKGGIDASRIASDPAFQRTRENGSEFGRAGKAGKILRTALRALLLNSADGRMVSRLTQRMMQVIQADLISVRGLRNVIDGEAELFFRLEAVNTVVNLAGGRRKRRLSEAHKAKLAESSKAYRFKSKFDGSNAPETAQF